MDLIVDSREPIKYYNWIESTFPQINVTRKALQEGDYKSSTCLIERKTWIDLYGSVTGSKGKPGRLWSQIDRMSTHAEHTGVIVTGSLSDTAAQCASHGIPFDSELLIRTIKDIHVRYGFSMLVFENEWHGLAFMIKAMKSYDEGKELIPMKRNPDILWARLFGLTSSQWKDLKVWYPSIPALIEASEADYQRIRGIGPAKAKTIKRLLSEVI